MLNYLVFDLISENRMTRNLADHLITHFNE